MNLADKLLNESKRAIRESRDAYDAILALDDAGKLSPLHVKWFNAYAEALNGGLVQVVDNIGKSGLWDLVRGFETVHGQKAQALAQSIEGAIDTVVEYNKRVNSDDDEYRGAEPEIIDTVESMLYDKTVTDPILTAIAAQYKSEA